MKYIVVFLFILFPFILSAQVLHNGITLPDTWPPRYETGTERAQMPMPYLKEKPVVIPVNTGRQLFVDSFLIAETTLKPIYHKAIMYSGNPVFYPTQEWENTTEGCPYADPFSDGLWYDEQAGKFKMWYRAGAGSIHKQDNQTFYTGYAESADGIHWERPVLDILEGTNIVDTCNRDASTMWLDKQEKDLSKRYKMFNVERRPTDKRWQYILKYSADGIHWTDVAQSGDIYDRSTAFYNPFTQKWVLSMRHSFPNSYRSRAYVENADPEMAVSMAHRVRRGVIDRFVHYWFSPDELEPRHPNPQFSDVDPGIYNFDVIPYESILLGQYSVWEGPENDDCLELGIQKRNEICLGYSRDGFHFSRPSHEVFIGVNETDGAWNWGNVQSVIGSPIIMGDSLYIYVGGRALSKIMWDGDTSTGLAKLRRDGFVSMRAVDKKEGILITEPLSFDGDYLFVNADVTGKLLVEVLDVNGTPIPGFSKADCMPLKYNSTKQQVVWKTSDTLGTLKSQNIRLKFYLTRGDLYSFWISPWKTGQSRGYTGGGGVNLSPTGVDVPF